MLKAFDPLHTALALKAERGERGAAVGNPLVQGAGWRVSHVICTAGPRDSAFEERHTGLSIAVVMAGTFSYEGEHGRSFMTPGSLLLGNSDACFSCGHEHGEGDRCLAFYYDSACFERIAADAGARSTRFISNRLPASRLTAPLVARAAHLLEDKDLAEELAYCLAGTVLKAHHNCRPARAHARDERRVAESVRFIEQTFHQPHSLECLANRTGLSPYHFLRLFKNAVGVSPHQFLLRTRLRAAAHRLVATDEPVTSIAYAVGFEDLSNFTRSFHSEHALSPRRYRERYR